MISQKCSNCGKTSEYTEKELDEVFPNSRERLICKNPMCNHTLSVCSGFLDNSQSEVGEVSFEKVF